MLAGRVYGKFRNAQRATGDLEKRNKKKYKNKSKTPEDMN